MSSLVGAPCSAPSSTPDMPIKPSILIAAIVAGALCVEGAGEKGFAVAGYLPEWRYLQWSPEEHKWR